MIIASILTELLACAILVITFLAFLFQRRKLAYTALALFVIYVLDFFIVSSLWPAEAKQSFWQNLGGFFFTLFIYGIPWLCLIGIPVSMLFYFKKKNKKMLWSAGGLVIIALFYLFILGAWLEAMG